MAVDRQSCVAVPLRPRFCRLPNDFGRMGQLPTHPELLDWLAVEFRDNGGSFKHLHRLIVTSAVYRQASTHNEANALIDASNQYLWRMNRRRLSAEEIRDTLLAVSGQLNDQMGGPGYYLFELERTEHSPHYEYHKHDPSDPASHRRSVYRFIVRSQPDPFMTTLDCADSSQSTPAARRRSLPCKPSRCSTTASTSPWPNPSPPACRPSPTTSTHKVDRL
ncbi:MAG: DUF1553 domain-containing protein [Planctomycetaceae bacterium]